MGPQALHEEDALFPDQFTVFDVRACEMLEGNFQKLENLVRPEAMWEGYLAFRDAVISETPPNLSLRDRDKHLWSKSLALQLERDIARSFSPERQIPRLRWL